MSRSLEILAGSEGENMDEADVAGVTRNFLDQRDCLNAVLDAMDSAVLLVDNNDKVIVANIMASVMFDKAMGEIQGQPFKKLLNDMFVPHIRNPEELWQWLETANAFSAFSNGHSPMNRCEVECRKDDAKTLSIYASHVFEGPVALGRIFVIEDITSLRKAEMILEAVSDAAREMNSELKIRKIVPQLFNVVKNRVPLDAMAIISVTPDNKGLVLGAIPDVFLGGSGFTCSLSIDCAEGAGFLVDIISDLSKSIDSDLDSNEGAASFVLPKICLQKALEAGMQSMVALPLKLFDKLAGIWILASSQPRSYLHSDMSFLEPVAGHLAVAVNNANLLERTSEMYSAAVRALAATVDIRDSHTMNHSEHVAILARVIATEMGLPQDEVEIIELAGLVHDIGKVGIPDAILNKPGPLDPAERSIMTNHSNLGASILERAGMLSELAPLILHHHECHNGSGYPYRLKGDNIPIGASILAVADAFDTMVSDRVYRKGMSLAAAKKELQDCSGGQFHPQVVKALINALDRALENSERWLNVILGQDLRSEHARLFEKRRPTLAEEAQFDSSITSKELSVLFRISQQMQKLLELDELLDHISHIVAEEMGYSNCIIMLPDDANENLVIKAGVGLSEKVLGFTIPWGKGIAWWVMENGKPQYVQDVSIDKRYYKVTPGVGSELHIPLESRGHRLGVLAVQKVEKNGFDSNDERLMMSIAGHVSSAVEVAQLHRQVKHAADTDFLTGVYNRRCFIFELNKILEDAFFGRVPMPVSLAIVDIDSLKQVNDTYGHLLGDQVLIHVANCLKKGFRACDVVARFGGDEFVIIIPGEDKASTTARLETMVSAWSKDFVIAPSESQCASLPLLSGCQLSGRRQIH